MDIKKQVGNRIKELRKLKNISQEELAFNANVDKKYLSDIELGKRNVSITILHSIIIALEISIKEFFTINNH
jgi:transcriptional regulator with XRE-family HTH domain